MAERGTHTTEYLEFVARDSENVGNAGNFSIEVLRKALENMNLTLINVAAHENKNV